MTHIAGFGRDQLLLLPEAVDDYVEVDNPVRFIEAFVDGLDLAGAGFARVEAKATGRPGYAPGDLLKLYIYGYLNRVRSSRRLEREAQRNIEVIWLVRGLKPDFKTIADFRRANCGAFKSVFRQFVLLCRRLDLYGRELLAVDGTRIKAVNNKDRNFTRSSLRAFIRAADERLNEYLERLDHGDVEDGATNGGARTKNLAEKIAALGEKRGRYQAMLAQLERTDEAQISLTDPDSRAMAAHTKVGVGYNVQIAVDAKHKLIVEQAVTNQVVDMGLLTQTAEPARQVLGVETIDVVADRGYFKNRGHRGLREGRLHSARSQTATRLLGPRGLLSQGRVSLRCRARRLCLPGREGAGADPPWPAARSRQSRLRQSKSLPRVPLARA
ncbi:MAG: transposase, partial [Roseiarcus sp.]